VRILIHTQFYPPEMGAPQARLSDLAGRLRGLGHEVVVLAAAPNYPTGRIFPGSPRGYHRQEIDGVVVHRSRIIPSNAPSLVRRLVSYLSFAASSLVAGMLRVGPADLVITESPPLFLAPTGWLLAKAKGARWVMNVSDLWPDSARSIGMLSERSSAYRALAAMARFFYRRADLVTGQSAEIVSEVSRQEPASRVWHLSNGVDVARFSPARRDQEIRERYLRPGETGFAYAGLHGLFQGLDTFLDAASMLREVPVRFLFFGDGPVKADLVARAAADGLDNVSFHPPLPHDQVASVLASMDGALIGLRSRIVGAVPSKIYEAMASGVPVVLAAAGEAVDIVRGAAITVEPGDAAAVADAVRRLAGDAGLRRALGETGRRLAVERYDREAIGRAFGEVIARLAR
jgi:glycosyltransferase involved in cell wall biosynthesis